ncbi:MAG: indole-3-glycerol phosphate synthase TrpC, partial [Pseudomonadota bacterium]
STPLLQLPSRLHSAAKVMTPPDILARILEVKREEIQVAKQELSEAALIQEIVRARDWPSHAPRGFLRAIQSKHAKGLAAVISEIKRASPSKGLLRDPYLPAEIAKDYEQGGAACLSVLTDREFFKGDSDDLIAARAATGIPVLRKDFMIDPYQVLQARHWGADCILLIVAAISDQQMQELEQAAFDQAMDVLIEVHDEEELGRAYNTHTSVSGSAGSCSRDREWNPHTTGCSAHARCRYQYISGRRGTHAGPITR